MTDERADDTDLGRILRSGPVEAPGRSRRQVQMAQAERDATLVGGEVVLETPGVTHVDPDPLAGAHLDRRWKEGVLGHADRDLPLRGRRAREQQREYHGAQTAHGESS